VESFTISFIANLSLSLTVKEFENRLRFDKVTAVSLVVQFYLELSVVVIDFSRYWAWRLAFQ